MDKRCRLMSAYSLSEREVRLKITGAKGWVMYYWAYEHDLSLFGEAPKRSTPGYVQQEKERILKAYGHR